MTERADPSLESQGWVGKKPCCVVLHCRQARHRRHVARKTAEPKLDAADGICGSSPHLEKCFDTSRGRRPPKILVLVAHVTNEFVLGLNILCAYEASMDIWLQILRLAQEELSLWSPGAGPGLSAW